MSKSAESTKTNTRTRERIREEIPGRFKVILLNDHYTTMEFVVQILQQVFHKSPQEAESIMLLVHRMGAGVAGVYIKQVAETKCAAVHNRARAAGFPLKCVMEPEQA